MADLVARLVVGFLPVLLFLAALIYLDGYKLVRLRTVLATIAVGGVMAGLCWLLDVRLIDMSGLDTATFSRYVAPIVEETIKAAIVVYLIRSNRIGFLVDAAILGFAVGAGFAVVENAYYIGVLSDSHLVVWIIRGFGTAIMHGGATAIFAVLCKSLSEGRGAMAARSLLPGLAAAMAIHSAFNHFFFSPLWSAVGILLALPPLLVAVFRRSERSLRRWLDVGFDADTELLELILSGELSRSPVGQYLQELKERFRGEVVADMLCYLRLHVELALRAKGILMMRESGFEAAPDEQTRAKFQELKFLERSIGKTGKLAMLPFLHVSGRELWQLYMLKD